VAAHGGEVRVNLGSEPDRDDSGLPPVDIEIPDDARELDRDVQAYHRELRAHRRRMRIGRLHGPLTRDGLVLPLLAGFLAMVLISGVLLTVFTAGQSGTPRQLPSPRVTNASIGPAPGTGGGTAAGQRTGKPASRLPDAAVVVNGGPLQLSSLASTVLALVPAGCQCSAALRQLRRQATAAGVNLYMVGTGRDLAQVRRLAARGGGPAAKVADDPHQVLAAAYHPHGLTAVLVRADGSVGPVARDLAHASRLAGQIRALAPATRNKS
jgi:hypothetical protein